MHSAIIVMISPQCVVYVHLGCVTKLKQTRPLAGSAVNRCMALTRGRDGDGLLGAG
eukprot:SAG25_NODE_5244_length_683_cov_1.585616_2_plen_55_part_01